MSSEFKTFKKKVFGGFDEADVMAYIADLAEERNKNAKERDSFEGETIELRYEMDELKAEIADLKEQLAEKEAELEASMQRERDYKVNILDEAEKAIGELQASYNDVRTDMETTTAHIGAELKRMANELELFRGVLERAGDRIGEIDELIASERDDSGECDNGAEDL